MGLPPRGGSLLELLRVDEIGVAALDFWKELRERSACYAAPEEYYRGGHVNICLIPVKGEKDVLQRTAGVPMSLLSWLNASAEMIAPALPAAADMPCAAARNFVGKTSAG